MYNAHITSAHSSEWDAINKGSQALTLVTMVASMTEPAAESAAVSLKSVAQVSSDK